MKEVWKFIPGYEGYYEASTLGRVRSVDRIVIRSGNVKVNYKGRILKPRIDSRGYYQVNLCNGVMKIFTVHKLIFITFRNEEYKNRDSHDIDHIDENKLNNHLTNLQLLSRSKNVKKSKTLYLSK